MVHISKYSTLFLQLYLVLYASEYMYNNKHTHTAMRIDLLTSWYSRITSTCIRKIDFILSPRDKTRQLLSVRVHPLRQLLANDRLWIFAIIQSRDQCARSNISTSLVESPVHESTVLVRVEDYILTCLICDTILCRLVIVRE